MHPLERQVYQGVRLGEAQWVQAGCEATSGECLGGVVELWLHVCGLFSRQVHVTRRPVAPALVCDGMNLVRYCSCKDSLVVHVNMSGLSLIHI